MTGYIMTCSIDRLGGLGNYLSDFILVACLFSGRMGMWGGLAEQGSQFNDLFLFRRIKYFAMRGIFDTIYVFLTGKLSCHHVF
jgi:hypothetical protein